MENEIKVMQYGVGKMSVYTMRYVYEKGAKIVAAVDVNKDVIGKDIGEIIGSENKNVIVEDVKDIEDIIAKTKPDIAIITTMSLLQDVEDALKTCAKLGVNAITTCEEAFYPQNSNPNLTNEINELAVKSNCTITGSGYQDIYWGQLISSLSGSTQTINKIIGQSSYNVEDYGIALAKAHGAGLTLDQFGENIASVDNITDEQRKEIIKKGEYMPSYMWNVNGWLCSKLGLDVENQTQKTVPTISNQDIYSKTLEMEVKKGSATGMEAIVTTTTKQGITIQSKCIGKIYEENEFDKNEWTIEGEPSTTLVINKPNTVELTCASVVNRLPDVINAKAGYITTEAIGELNFKSKVLNKYVVD